MENLQNNSFRFFPFLVISTLFLPVFFLQCGSQSDEDVLRETIAKIGNYAEKRELGNILAYISENYRDGEERNHEQVEALLETYLRGYRGIAVNVLGTKILSLAQSAAEIETDVALSSGAAKLFRKALRYSGEFYRFNMTWMKEEKTWKCKSASWRYIPLDELFPESFKVLKKLFPGSF